MRSLPRPADIPGLESVEQALQRAERADSFGPAFTVCVCNSEGRMLAGARLAGFDQLKRFGREMAKLGYGADILGDRYLGCDVVFAPTPAAKDIFDDGEPITSPSPL
ncbi:MAG: hypothetical protein K0R58_4017 [Ramlibacter sp.]|jgi:hypothetical protein|nr:hypothetical protein [Ramlibacter sp.]